MKRSSILKLFSAVVLIGFAALIVQRSEFLSNLDAEYITGWSSALGYWGPVLIVALMWLAVVASPIPSAPIAVASGILYGHAWGTSYVAIGAELGAVTAFLIARYFARDAVSKWTKGKLDKGLLGSQNALTLTVFLSRLLPFVSFDAFSYAAGISSIRLWRFAAATFAGIIPASFFLTHLGAIANTADLGNTTWIIAGLGMVTGVSIIAGTFWVSKKANPV